VKRQVLLVWTVGSNEMQLAFTLPSPLFSSPTFVGDLQVTNVQTTDPVLGEFLGSTAKFCQGFASWGSINVRPPHTSWAVTPLSDNNRACGCSGVRIACSVHRVPHGRL
jgi:hypothetical protein